MAAVQWEQREPGIYMRLGKDGKAIYRAVRTSGPRDPETGKYPQEVRTFNGAKVQNALKAARLWRAEGIVASEAGNRPSSNRKLTLRAAYEAVHADGEYASKTARLHASFWRALTTADPRLAGMRLQDISPDYLQAVLKRIEAPSVREHSRILVSTIYNLLQVTPNPGVKPPKKRTRKARMAEANGTRGRYLDDGTVERILSGIPERYRAAVVLMWRAGLRPGEVWALRVGKVDPTTNVVTIDEAVSEGEVGPTKTGIERKPVLTPSTMAVLVNHIRTYSDLADTEALVFTHRSGGAMVDHHNFRTRVWGPACEQAGVDADPYDLRHTAISNAVSAGADLASVAEMCGNSIPVLAKHYVHRTDEGQRRTAAILEDAFAGTRG